MPRLNHGERSLEMIAAAASKLADFGTVPLQLLRIRPLTDQLDVT
jgi:hypothetical protein